MIGTKRPVVLVIMDGVGLASNDVGNAVRLSRTPNLNTLWNNFKKSSGRLKASESAVGLDQGYAGNSEVGHLNIGAGQVVVQSLQQINESISNGTFKNNQIIIDALKYAIKNSRNVHLMGVLSNAGVHAYIKHVYALLEICHSYGISPFIHAFLDGRDTGEKDAFFYIDNLNRLMRELGCGKFASLTGRYFAMDRNLNWGRTEKAYDALMGIRGRVEKDVFIALQNAYKLGEKDEVFEPTIIVDDNGKPVGPIGPSDVVIFFNFREDRARQITQALIQDNFSGFERDVFYPDLNVISFVGYSEGLDTKVVFPSVKIASTVPNIIARNGLKQLHIAETEKYAHVTYFFNGGIEEKHEGESFFMIKSPEVKDYVETPEMSAFKIKNELVTQINKGNFDFYVVNFANPDMIGHTGELDKAITAMEVTDQCVGEVVYATLQAGGVCLITSDHGNCEYMIDLVTGKKDKAHTLNNVPFMIVDDPKKFSVVYKLFEDDDIRKPLNIQLPNLPKIGSPEDEPPVGILADIGTTVLYLLGLTPSEDMTGINLLENT